MNHSTRAPTFEEWRPIGGYEGIYEVSSFGRVRSLSRRDSRGHLAHGRELKPHRLPNGYLIVTISFGKSRRDYIHRLVLETFGGPCPEGMECAHGNGDRSDNRLSNLRWATRQENALDKGGHGTLRKGENAYQAKLTEKRVRELRQSSLPSVHFANLWGVAPQVVRRARSGISWKHVK